MIMQTILTAIAEGNLRMGMERMEHNSELEDAMNRVCRLEKELSATLNEEQAGLLEQLLDAMENEHNCDAQNRFIRGYSLGVLMATEVMEERDKFLIEEEYIP